MPIRLARPSAIPHRRILPLSALITLTCAAFALAASAHAQIARPWGTCPPAANHGGGVHVPSLPTVPVGRGFLAPRDGIGNPAFRACWRNDGVGRFRVLAHRGIVWSGYGQASNLWLDGGSFSSSSSRSSKRNWAGIQGLARPTDLIDYPMNAREERRLARAERRARVKARAAALREKLALLPDPAADVSDPEQRAFTAHASALTTAGWRALAKGENDAAVELMRDACSAEPESGAAKAALAFVATMAGRDAIARLAGEQAAAKDPNWREGVTLEWLAERVGHDAALNLHDKFRATR